MTEQEKEELRELRILSQRLKEQKVLLQNEIDDNTMAINNLKKWKKGRGIGFFVILTINLLFILSLFPQVNFWGVNSAERGHNLNSTVTFALSSTSMLFAFGITIALSIFTILVGIKLVMELGSSRGAQVLAARFRKKNYYTEYNELIPKTKELADAMFDLSTRKQETDRRLKELEAIETPWYLQ